MEETDDDQTTNEAVLRESPGIDVFGDVHGQAAALVKGLEALDYENLSGIYRHPKGRKALFLGDLIDRGPNNRQVVSLVRKMVENGEAICLMGNHELNAIHFALPHPEGSGHLRDRTDKNLFQHVAFLHEYRTKDARESLASDLEFFRTLPLSIELDGLRAVHACWSEAHLKQFSAAERNGARRDEEFWLQTSSLGQRKFNAAEVILKGPEKELPGGRTFLDKDGNERRHARIKWWSDSTLPIDRIIGPPSLFEAVSDLQEFDASEYAYASDDPIVFFGHYWMRNEAGIPRVTRTANIQCLDFSVGSGDGQLGIYCWHHEERLIAENLHAVSADGSEIRKGKSV